MNDTITFKYNILVAYWRGVLASPSIYVSDVYAVLSSYPTFLHRLASAFRQNSMLRRAEHELAIRCLHVALFCYST
jgi:hypothetical protein